jgi:hypothetical protein
MLPPLQVVEAEFGFAMDSPAGNVSVKLRAVALTAPLLLSIVNVSVLTAFRATVAGLKALEKPGAVSVFRVSVAVPLLPDEEVRSPLVLTNDPLVDVVTSACTVQTLPAATLPPV